MSQRLPGGPVLRLLDKYGKLIARGKLVLQSSASGKQQTWTGSLQALRTATAARFTVRIYQGSPWDIKGTVGPSQGWSGLQPPDMMLDNVNVAKSDIVLVSFKLSVENV
jgi:hypothetical protein